MILKAELHCHIEGAAAPELVIEQARKYGKDPSPFIRDGSFVWHDSTSFLAAYDFSADLFRTEEDYARLADHYLTSLARDGAIQLWNAATGAALRTIRVEPGDTDALALAPDGKSIAVAGLNNTVRRFELESGKEVEADDAPRAPLTSVVLGAANALVAASAGRLYRWEVDAGMPSSAVAGKADVDTVLAATLLEGQRYSGTALRKFFGITRHRRARPFFQRQLFDGRNERRRGGGALRHGAGPRS